MQDLLDDWGLWGLFISAFISATLLPGGSEAILAGLLLHGQHERWALWLAATSGNTLGGLSSWAIGWLVAQRWPSRQLVETQQQRAIRWLSRHGGPVLLLSWLPVIGDALCVAAGWLGMRFSSSLLYIACGKGLRYLVILWLVG
jgi:membrane protein YqaA with SNARE-associated domain